MAVFCQYLWSSAVILLLCEVRAREQVVVDAVGSQVDAAKRTLRALEPVWPGCRKLRELLVDVEQRAKDVVVAVGTKPVTVARSGSGKKRKGSGQDTIFVAGPVSRPGLQGQTWQYAPMSTAIDAANKRARIQPGNYETSDTRTVVREDEFAQPAATGIPPYQQQSGPLQTLYNLGPSQHPTPMQTPIVTTGHANINFDLFDVGGVTFNGLDMLQGFTGDMASFWASLGDPFVPPTPSQAQMGTGLGPAGQPASSTKPTTGYAASNPGGTPSSTGVGPSPGPLSSSAGNWQFGGSGSGGGGEGGGGGGGAPTNTQHTTPGGSTVPMSAQSQHTPLQGLGSALGVGAVGDGIGDDFWNQVTGGQFDWAADPNVPFNI